MPTTQYACILSGPREGWGGGESKYKSGPLPPPAPSAVLTQPPAAPQPPGDPRPGGEGHRPSSHRSWGVRTRADHHRPLSPPPFPSWSWPACSAVSSTFFDEFSFPAYCQLLLDASVPTMYSNQSLLATTTDFSRFCYGQVIPLYPYKVPVCTRITRGRGGMGRIPLCMMHPLKKAPTHPHKSFLHDHPHTTRTR